MKVPYIVKFSIFFSFVTMASLPSNGQKSTPPKPVHAQTGQYYLGTSDNQKHCPGAYFIYIDQKRKTGGIFDIAHMQEFDQFEITSDGGISFNWSQLADLKYHFDGKLNPGKLSGDVSELNSASSKLVFACKIEAERVAAANEHAMPRPYYAHFSNEDYSEEAGDLLGMDLRFFATDSGNKGVITFYEGYWDEPIMVTMAITDVKVKTQQVYFSAVTPKGTTNYLLKLTTTGAVLHRTNAGPDYANVGIKLKKVTQALPMIFW